MKLNKQKIHKIASNSFFETFSFPMKLAKNFRQIQEHLSQIRHCWKFTLIISFKCKCITHIFYIFKVNKPTVVPIAVTSDLLELLFQLRWTRGLMFVFLKSSRIFFSVVQRFTSSIQHILSKSEKNYYLWTQLKLE